MNTNTVLDLSRKSNAQSDSSHPKITLNDNIQIVKPIARLPWAITWYQSLWSVNSSYVTSTTGEKIKDERKPEGQDIRPDKLDMGGTEENSNFQKECIIKKREMSTRKLRDCSEMVRFTPILDIACCDGPVMFERVSNPNFALTVEHNETVDIPDSTNKNSECERRHISLKTYVCIYCNQGFKSLFCYQKHKKRHLNPVSVDITATHDSSKTRDSRAKTKDLNVQFFPCKKCGCKFPSYYFVHKHRKVCHKYEN